MKEHQAMFNQINAIISYLPENKRNILPKDLVNFFKEKANCLPEKAIDKNLPLGEQDLADETMLMLYYINTLLKQK